MLCGRKNTAMSNPAVSHLNGMKVYTDRPAKIEFLPVGVRVSEPSHAIIQFHADRLTLPEQLGPLSIRCAFQGERIYEVNRTRFAVNDRSYLVLNCGQRYTSQIDSETKVESFHICFWPSLAAETLRLSGLGWRERRRVSDAVDPVRLGQLAARLRKVADLPRINHDDRQAMRNRSNDRR